MQDFKFFQLEMKSNECTDDSDNIEIKVRDRNEELKLSFHSMKKHFMNFITLLVSSLIH